MIGVLFFRFTSDMDFNVNPARLSEKDCFGANPASAVSQPGAQPVPEESESGVVWAKENHFKEAISRANEANNFVKKIPRRSKQFRSDSTESE